ncbi:MAG: D-alanine--D-alanine ligase [Gammaproteobacteria bacterium]|nr:MAG: D-alanine--D-alanine ligase [Gammaproteobacteria bacterium]
MSESNVRVAVLQGGPSAEAAVSRVSAGGVVTALSDRVAAVQCIELDAGIVDALRSFRPDVVFPALHGPPGEDGTVQGMLEMLGYPYVGSGVRASACAMDKLVSKQIFRAAGLPLARDVVVRADDGFAAALGRIHDDLGERVVVKPVRQGSALGVTLVDNVQQLTGALERALELDDVVLVEERVDGREITVGVLDIVAADGSVSSRPHPVIEILTPAGTWYDYQHRYTPGHSEHVVPAEMVPDVAADLQQVAMTAHAWLGCRDLSRADFVVAKDRFVLLEVNNLPGMTPTSLYPDGALYLGYDFPGLMELLVRNALRRGPDLRLETAAPLAGARRQD